MCKIICYSINDNVFDLYDKDLTPNITVNEVFEGSHSLRNLNLYFMSSIFIH